MSINQKKKLFMLGVGQVALNVAKLASNFDLTGTTREKNKIELLKSASIEPLFLSNEFSSDEQNELTKYLSHGKLLVTFPPDGKSDQTFSTLCKTQDSIIYISSTSVYGNYEGIVTEKTPVDYENPTSKLRLQAEQYWLEKGAIVLRAPGLYDENSGLHIRLRNGTYRLPIKSENYTSRIHLQDLGKIILAAFLKPLPKGSIYLVGDLKPAAQKEVATWLCQQMHLPMPPNATPDAVSRFNTNRRIQADKILNELNIELQFPTYIEGYKNCLEKLS